MILEETDTSVFSAASTGERADSWSEPGSHRDISMMTNYGDEPIILVVDDDAPTRFLLRKFLERENFRIVEAANGAEALRIVETVNPDLILLDIQMPQIDGIQTCARLRLRPENHHTPILMLTGLVDDAMIEQSFAVGATDYLTKPPNPVALRHRVHRLISAFRSDRLLRDTEARIQSVVRHASDAIITLDRHFTIVSANPTTARLFGKRPEDLPGLPISNLIDLKPSQIRQTSIPFGTEGRLDSGNRIPVEVTTGDFISNGQPFHTLIVRDISERKKNELRLRESRRLLQSTLDTLSAHIAILDRDGTILAVNQAWKRFADQNGLADPNYGVGQNYLTLCDDATGVNSGEASRVGEAIRRIIEGTRDEYRLEYPCHGPRENRWFVTRIAHHPSAPDAPVVIAHEDSTTQHLAEEGLHQANQFMSRTLEAIPNGIAVIETTGRLKYANHRLAQSLSAIPSEVIGRRFIHFISRKGRQLMKDSVRKLHNLETELAEFETSLCGRDGCFVPVRLSLVRVSQDKTIVAIVEDLSERQALNEVLRRRDEEWVATVDAIPDFILLEDQDGTLKRCNNAVTEFLKRPYRDLIGKKTTELFFGPDEQGIRPFREAIGKQPEFRFPGSDRWFEINSYWIPQERGIGTGWVHIIQDITTRRLADHAMRRLNTAIEQIAESVVMLNGKGIIQFVNPAFEQTTGFQRGETYERRVFSLALGPVDRKTRREVTRALLGGKDWHGVYTARRKDGGTYQEEASISPVRDETGRLQNMVAVCRDVTDQLRYESIAEAVNVMDNAGYIFSGIRHEMGNPINSIKTALTVLSRADNPSRETVSKYLDRSLIEIGRVEYLLRTLRSFSMFETPALEALPIIPFLERFCTLVEEDFAKRGIRIRREFDQNAGLVWFDQRGLHQALLNLFANAADAMQDHENPVITLKVTSGPRLVTLAIIDQGTGLTPQQASQLFKPFFTSKPHGTGLGLVITKKLITKMNGTIDILPGPVSGCQANVTLEAVQYEELQSI